MPQYLIGQMVEARRQCHDAYSHINSFVILRVLISAGAEKKSTSSTDWSVSKQSFKTCHKVTKCTYMQNRQQKRKKVLIYIKCSQLWRKEISYCNSFSENDNCNVHSSCGGAVWWWGGVRRQWLPTCLGLGCYSVTGYYQLHGVWSGLRLLSKADLLVALPAVARAWPVRPVDNVLVRSLCWGTYDHVLGSSVD